MKYTVLLFAFLAITACELEPLQLGVYSYTAVDAVHAADDRTAYVLDRYIRGADCTPVPLLCWRDGEQRMLLAEWAERPLIAGDDLVIAISSEHSEYGFNLLVIQPGQLLRSIPLSEHLVFLDYDLAENAGEWGIVFLLLRQFKWKPPSRVIYRLDPLDSQLVGVLALPWDADHMAVTPDGDYAYCCDYGEGTLWEVELSSGLVREVEIPGGFRYVIDISPDGGLLLYQDYEQNYKIYDLATKEVTVLDLGDRDCARRFDSDGRVIFRQRCDVYSLDLSSGEISKVIDVPTDVPDY
ncbi:hypothetical protein KAU45_07015 [bacterium]|nr:hypothetical protein [bacterium]